MTVEPAAPASVRTSAAPSSAPGRAQRRRAGGVMASVILHAAMLGALCLAAARLKPAPAPVVAVAMVFEPPAAPPLSTFASAPLAVQPTAEPVALTPTLPSRTLRAITPADRPHPARAAPAAPPAPGPAPAAASAQPPPPPSAGDLAGLKLRIRDAVKAATVYPAVARQMHREGRAHVAFAYVDGTVQGVSLIQSSRSGLLDEAALAAVRRAAYPRPLPGMAGVRLALDVWVNFGLETE